ncbi:MAG: Uma2 family endonuclease [Oscillospiraceae bacterium]|nr:Uma2 family endonuclease [Oscillospiraceae bacterium]
MNEWHEFLEEQLKDPEICSEWDALEPEFAGLKMSEFRNYEYDDHTKEIKEIIDGKIYYMGGGTLLHIDVITNIGYSFNRYFDDNKKNCKAYTSDLRVFLDSKSKKNFVLPDVAILCGVSVLYEVSKGFKAGYRGNPELIVEVMSDGTRELDRMDKYKLYERAGVKEYWVVEPELKSIEQYVLVDGRYDLKNVVVLLSKTKLNDLTEEQKANYKAIIKPTMFEDLEIDLNKIFPLEEQEEYDDYDEEENEDTKN